MAKKERGFEPRGLTIGYKELGTISIDELLHAIAADVHALKDIYGVKYVKAPRLKLFITNEYGAAANGRTDILHAYPPLPPRVPGLRVVAARSGQKGARKT